MNKERKKVMMEEKEKKKEGKGRANSKMQRTNSLPKAAAVDGGSGQSEIE